MTVRLKAPSTLSKVQKDYWDDMYEAQSRKIAQDDAGYDALGMHDGMGCANCHWFLSPEACVLVDGDISPTGMSRFYMKEPVQPVTVVEASDDDATEYVMPMMGKSAEKNIVTAILHGVKTLLKPNIITQESGNSGKNEPLSFFAVKDVNGDARLRFMAVVSNNFVDRDNEIITEAAHKEYVGWATLNETYPELWLWHSSAKSRWGQADWLDVCDGFLVASGLVDKGYEYIAHNLQEQAKAGNPNGVSHGFLCAKSGQEITLYRTFELSPLPLTAAANEWTGFSTTSGEGMPFTQQKRKWLEDVAGVSPEAITTLEAAASTVAKELKAKGVAYKDVAADAVAEPVAAAPVVVETVKRSPLDAAIMSITGIKAAIPAVAAAPVVAAPVAVAAPAAKEVAPPAASAEGVPPPAAEGTVGVTTLSSKEYIALDEKIAALGTAVAASTKQMSDLAELFKQSIVKLSASEDAKTANFFKARVDELPAGYRASVAAGNTNTQTEKLVVEAAKAVEKNGWWSDVVMKGMSES